MLNEYNDYELVSLAKEGNEEAIEIIYKKYKPIIISKSTDAIVNANHHGIEISDIMQEGFIGLDEAIKDFSEIDNTSFYTFAMLCINRQIINFLRKSTREKDKILNDAVIIDDYVEKNLKDDFDTEFAFMVREEEESILQEFEKSFTEFEKKVFKLKFEGYSFEEIANTLSKDVKSIYNTFQRIKTKVKKIIEKADYLSKF
jgi:RNA polymerase sporulation-specific sigma factor